MLSTPRLITSVWFVSFKPVALKTGKFIMYWSSIGLEDVGVPGLVESGINLNMLCKTPSNVNETLVTDGVDCGDAGTRGIIA